MREVNHANIHNILNQNKQKAEKQFEKKMEYFTSREQINILFSYLKNEVKDIENFYKIEAIENAVSLLKELIKANSEINKKMIHKKISKTTEIVKNQKKENKRQLKAQKKLNTNINHVDELLESLTNFPSRKTYDYEFVLFQIMNLRDLQKIQQLLVEMKHVINLKDKSDRSLFLNVASEYLCAVHNVSRQREDVLYFNNILLLLQNNPFFKLDTKERNSILEKVYIYLDRINTKDDNAKEQIKWLNNLKHVIKNNPKVKCNLEDLTMQYNIKLGFDQLLEEELEICQTPITKQYYPDRVVINDYMLTIDKKEAEELDDALTAKILPNGNYLLGGHIASVTGYFDYHSSFVQNSICKSTTIYLPGLFDSMFPPEFSIKTASLRPNEPKLAKSYLFEITPDGEIVNEKFMKTIITSNKKATYDEINTIMEKGTEDEKLLKTVKTLREISTVIAIKHKESDLYKLIKTKREDPSQTKLGQTTAEVMVNRIMNLINTQVATYFANSKEGYPFLYRVLKLDDDTHDYLDIMFEKLSETNDKYKLDRLYQIIVGIYPKAYYDTQGEHVGVMQKHYCHVTSCLRRGPDDLSEHALDVCYFQNPSDKQLTELEQEVNQKKALFNQKAIEIDFFTNEYQKRKILTKK